MKRIRRESIIGLNGTEHNFWLLSDPYNDTITKVVEPKRIQCLDEIVSSDDISALESNLGGLATGKYPQVRAWTLPPVINAYSAPIKVFFNPNNRCPYSCITCMNSGMGYSNLPPNVADEVFRQIIEMPIFAVKIAGGEPTIMNNFFKYAAQAVGQGIKVSTTTSGVNVTEEWAEEAKKLGIKVTVSLDGPKKISDIQRPGTYEAAIQAISLFKRINYPVIINMVHTKYNNSVPIIDRMFDIARENGARGIELSILRPSGGGLCNDLWIPDGQYQDGTVAMVVGRVRHHPYINQYGLVTHVNRNVLPGKEVYVLPIEEIFNVHCSAGWANMGINADGSIDTCMFLPPDYLPAASVLSDELFSDNQYLLHVWQNDPTIARLRAYNIARKGCSKCEFPKSPLVMGCMAMEQYLGHDPSHNLH
ncbi:MAG: radical SAM protein [archaeon]